MADAINNVAPGGFEPQCSGHNVSAPSAYDATNITGALQAPNGGPASRQDLDTLHNDGDNASPSSPGKRPTFKDGDIEIFIAREWEASRQEVLRQLLSDTIESDLERRLNKFAARCGISPDAVIKLAALEPQIVSTVLTMDPKKRNGAERCVHRFCLDLKNFAGSSVVESVKLPALGPSSVHLAARKGLVHEDSMGRSQKLCKSMDLATLVRGAAGDLRLVIQYHKHTTDEGGTQDYCEKDMHSFARAVRTHGTSHVDAHRMMSTTCTVVPAGVPIPVFYVAVADGPYWTKERLKTLRQAGRGSDQVRPGGFYVRSTSQLDEFFEAVASA